MEASISMKLFWTLGRRGWIWHLHLYLRGASISVKLFETVRRCGTQRINLASATLASADLHWQINFRFSINSLQIKNIITAPRSDMIMIINSVYFYFLSISNQSQLKLLQNFLLNFIFYAQIYILCSINISNLIFYIYICIYV